jgi:hypothetical protein
MEDVQCDLESDVQWTRVVGAAPRWEVNLEARSQWGIARWEIYITGQR